MPWARPDSRCGKSTTEQKTPLRLHVPVPVPVRPSQVGAVCVLSDRVKETYADLQLDALSPWKVKELRNVVSKWQKAMRERRGWNSIFDSNRK